MLAWVIIVYSSNWEKNPHCAVCDSIFINKKILLLLANKKNKLILYFQKLRNLLFNVDNLKLVYQAYHIQGGFLTEKSRKILVHGFIDLKKEALLKEFKGEPLEDWMLVYTIIIF